MTKPLPSPMMPHRTHDEEAEQAFVVALKSFIGTEIEPGCRELSNIVEASLDEQGSGGVDPHVRVRREMEGNPFYQAWHTMTRTAQDMMWDSVAGPVDRQMDEMVERADIKNPLGSLSVNPEFVAPPYIRSRDVHRMPGNYTGCYRNGDVRQGALYDCGGFIYNMGGRNGGHLNDVRGHTLASHYFTRFPGKEPKRILEMGCSAGNSTVAVAGYFPEAEYHAIDLGESLLRYAWARAEHLGVGVHFSQQDAAKTNFDDASFDLVVSCVMLHETSHAAVADIMAECYRLLAPGGVMAHLEVPSRYEDLDTWARIRGDYEAQVNNEPFWRGALSRDYKAEAEQQGFENIAFGFQDATRKASREGGVFRPESLGVHRSWMVVSAQKPF